MGGVIHYSISNSTNRSKIARHIALRHEIRKRKNGKRGKHQYIDLGAGLGR